MIGALVAGITGSGGASLSSYESIATTTGNSSNQTITFNSIPSTFKHLQIRMLSRSTDTGTGTASFTIRCNNDTATNYASHWLFGNGSATSAGGVSSASSITAGDIIANGATASCYSATIIDILDYGSTSKYKTIRVFNGSQDNTTGVSFRVRLHSGLWMSTSTITRLDFILSQVWDSNSTFALYGIKEA
jgi:hypothetical protein